jgi:hypothetical protein
VSHRRPASCFIFSQRLRPQGRVGLRWMLKGLWGDSMQKVSLLHRERGTHHPLIISEVQTALAVTWHGRVRTCFCLKKRAVPKEKCPLLYFLFCFVFASEGSFSRGFLSAFTAYRELQSSGLFSTP